MALALAAVIPLLAHVQDLMRTLRNLLVSSVGIRLPGENNYRRQ